MHIAMKPVRTLKVTSSGTSVQSSSIADNRFYIRVVSDAACHIAIGVNPTATTSDIYIPAADVEYFKISPGEKVAVIGSANVYISELSE
jgi:hypothetical protein